MCFQFCLAGCCFWTDVLWVYVDWVFISVDVKLTSVRENKMKHQNKTKKTKKTHCFMSTQSLVTVRTYKHTLFFSFFLFFKSLLTGVCGKKHKLYLFSQ